MALLPRFLKEKGGSPHTAVKICMVGTFSCFCRFSDTFVNFLKDNVITVNSQCFGSSYCRIKLCKNNLNRNKNT